jgi:hypothetical protein
VILLLLHLQVVIRIVLWRQPRPEERNKILMGDVWQGIMIDHCARVFLCYVTHSAGQAGKKWSDTQLECNTQALGTPAFGQILQYWVFTPSNSKSLKILRPSSFPASGATNKASTAGNCAKRERTCQRPTNQSKSKRRSTGLTVLALPPRDFSTA